MKKEEILGHLFILNQGLYQLEDNANRVAAQWRWKDNLSEAEAFSLHTSDEISDIANKLQENLYNLMAKIAE